ncbi:MAG: hypothetical protein K0Q95_1583 [Bacteroidota bacterium]|jgi:tRNA(Ile)-lysidine synthase|nr:hypothetical protein [Bacteroidota bacterium]
MLTDLKSFISKEKLFLPQDKILLAVSGGIDSIAMCDIFHRAGINFGIAHCNFKLRTNESDLDESFVEEVAEKYNAPFHSISFSTKTYAKKNKLSIQEAARNIRYEWFEEIRKQNKYAFVATAHHKDDSIETFFINLIRGTGIAGMHGILPKQGNIIRPLMFTDKEAIRKYVKTNKLKFREDTSNASDKYLRNKIRLSIIPSLKKLNPAVESSLYTAIDNIRNAELIYRKEIERTRKSVAQTNGDIINFSIDKLKQLEPLPSYLHEFLSPYNFNGSTVTRIIDSLDRSSGKIFLSGTHRIVKDRDSLILQPKTKQRQPSFTLKKDQEHISLGDKNISIKMLPAGTKFSLSLSAASLDFDRLKFPLKIRKWKEGDAFQPLGMSGKKKLSDFFIDKKFSLAEKENTWLMLSGDQIVWVIGHRIDDRFKVNDKTRRIYFAELSE